MHHVSAAGPRLARSPASPGRRRRRTTGTSAANRAGASRPGPASRPVVRPGDGARDRPPPGPRERPRARPRRPARTSSRGAVRRRRPPATRQKPLGDARVERQARRQLYEERPEPVAQRRGFGAELRQPLARLRQPRLVGDRLGQLERKSKALGRRRRPPRVGLRPMRPVEAAVDLRRREFGRRSAAGRSPRRGGSARPRRPGCSSRPCRCGWWGARSMRGQRRPGLWVRSSAEQEVPRPSGRAR